MWQFLIFAICGLMPFVTRAETAYDTTEQKALVADVRESVDFIRGDDIEEIRDFIQKEDPDFISQVSNMPVADQVPVMRGWLAKKMFYFYYDKYMAEIKEKSAQSGRDIKSETYPKDKSKLRKKKQEPYTMTERYYWLDRGVLDDKKCDQDILKRRACDYPDGFEEYEIGHTTIIGNDDNGTIRIMESLMVWKDDVAGNSTKSLKFTLESVSTDKDKYSEYGFTIEAGGATEKYTDHHRWRNQEAADIRAGKYRKPTRQEQQEFRKRYKNTAFAGRLFAIMDTSRKWLSSHIPDAAVTQITSNYNYSHETYMDKRGYRIEIEDEEE